MFAPYSEAYRQLIAYTIPSRQVEAMRGTIRPIPLGSEERADYRKTMAGGFLTGLSFSTARRRNPFEASATLEKPLTRESLFTLFCIF